MGVPRLYKWLMTRYPSCRTYFNEITWSGCDVFCIDLNGLLHAVVYGVYSDPKSIRDQDIYQDILDEITKLICMVKPRICVYISTDGVAPVSKMAEQRKRRCLQLPGAEFAEQEFEELWRDLYKKSPPGAAKFDSNRISPGTQFMRDLHQFLVPNILKSMKQNPVWRHLTVYVSGVNTPGEGEKKIWNYIRNFQKSSDYVEDVHFVVHGLDVDLVLQGLLTMEKVSLFRNRVLFSASQSQAGSGSNIEEKLGFPEYEVVYLPYLRNLIYMDIWDQQRDVYVGDRMNSETNDKYIDLEERGCNHDCDESMIRDYILVMSLTGNDFLPPQRIFKVGDKLAVAVDIYRRYLFDICLQDDVQCHHLMRPNGQIIWTNFRKFLILAAEYECSVNASDDPYDEQFFIEIVESFLLGGVEIDLETLTALLPEYKSESDYEAGTLEPIINRALETKRSDDAKIVPAMCRMYLKTLEYTSGYYVTSTTFWEHQYMTHFALSPLALLYFLPELKCDFTEAQIKHAEVDLNIPRVVATPTDQYVQLACILKTPYLLPEKFHCLVNEPSLKNFYSSKLTLVDPTSDDTLSVPKMWPVIPLKNMRAAVIGLYEDHDYKANRQFYTICLRKGNSENSVDCIKEFDLDIPASLRKGIVMSNILDDESYDFSDMRNSKDLAKLVNTQGGVYDPFSEPLNTKRMTILPSIRSDRTANPFMTGSKTFGSSLYICPRIDTNTYANLAVIVEYKLIDTLIYNFFLRKLALNRFRIRPKAVYNGIEVRTIVANEMRSQYPKLVLLYEKFTKFFNEFGCLREILVIGGVPLAECYKILGIYLPLKDGIIRVPLGIHNRDGILITKHHVSGYYNRSFSSLTKHSEGAQDPDYTTLKVALQDYHTDRGIYTVGGSSFNGPWSEGEELWDQYKSEINEAMSNTRNLEIEELVDQLDFNSLEFPMGAMIDALDIPEMTTWADQLVAAGLGAVDMIQQVSAALTGTFNIVEITPVMGMAAPHTPYYNERSTMGDLHMLKQIILDELGLYVRAVKFPYIEETAKPKRINDMPLVWNRSKSKPLIEGQNRKLWRDIMKLCQVLKMPAKSVRKLVGLRTYNSSGLIWDLGLGITLRDRDIMYGAPEYVRLRCPASKGCPSCETCQSTPPYKMVVYSEHVIKSVNEFKEAWPNLYEAIISDAKPDLLTIVDNMLAKAPPTFNHRSSNKELAKVLLNRYNNWRSSCIVTDVPLRILQLHSKNEFIRYNELAESRAQIEKKMREVWKSQPLYPRFLKERLSKPMTTPYSMEMNRPPPDIGSLVTVMLNGFHYHMRSDSPEFGQGMVIGVEDDIGQVSGRTDHSNMDIYILLFRGNWLCSRLNSRLPGKWGIKVPYRNVYVH